MQNMDFLGELIILVAVTVLATLILTRLRLPPVIGLLAGGALAGPYGLRLISNAHDIEVLAEIGVILLLFSIGLEFSISRFLRLGRLLLFGGLLQVGMTLALVIVGSRLLGADVAQSWVYGFIAALSSTALVVRALEERRELNAPHGRLIFGTLIFQDLCIVPMVLALPIIAGKGGGNVWLDAGKITGLALLTVGLIYLASKTLLPWLLHHISMTGSRELFLLTTIGIGVGIAWATGQVGLSLALGAFLAGVALAETDFAERARIEVLPLRDVLTSLFFASMGMLFDWRVLVSAPLTVLLLVGGFIIGKGLVATVAAMILRFPARLAIMAGMGLAQFGEFGFVITRQAQTLEILGDNETRALLCAGVISMVLTPLVIRLAPHLAAGSRMLQPLEQLLGVQRPDTPDDDECPQGGNVVVIGFGTAGRLLAEALRLNDIPYIILELNSETVRQARALGEPIYYADAGSVEALRHYHVDKALAAAVNINDMPSALRCLKGLRELAPDLPVIIRVPYEGRRQRFVEAGAKHVVTEDFEAGVRVMVLTLQQVGVETSYDSPHLQLVHKLRDEKAAESSGQI
ncbi:cation:proton antiporter [bacterium]|nr:cation:proton antiporter [bacterium]